MRIQRSQESLPFLDDYIKHLELRTAGTVKNVLNSHMKGLHSTDYLTRLDNGY